VALCKSPVVFTTEAAVRAIPVATNVTVKPLAIAVKVFGPGTHPSVHPPTVATPELLVVAELPVVVAPPGVNTNMTGTPGIGAPRWSFTITEGNSVTGIPMSALREVREFAATLVTTGGPVVSPPPHASRYRPSDSDVKTQIRASDLAPAELAMKLRSAVTGPNETKCAGSCALLNPLEPGALPPYSLVSTR
jgi:hypothetical protein